MYQLKCLERKELIQQEFTSLYETMMNCFSKFLLQLKWLERKELIRQEFTSLYETITTRQQQLLADMEEVWYAMLNL